MPLSTLRSSTRSGPVWTIGKCGSITCHCSSLNQNDALMIQFLLLED